LAAADIRARLTAGSTLLTYVTDDEDRLWALVATSDHICAERIEKITTGWLHKMVLAHLDGSRRGRLVPEPTTGKLATPHILYQLQKLLIEPVATHLDRAQTIYVVPAGPLHYIPLGALVAWPEEGDVHAKRATIMKRRIVHAPSATVLFEYSHKGRPGRNHSLLVIAPSDDRLRFHEGAARAIANRSVAASLTGDLATKEAFLRQAPEYEIVCFLGHAFFDRSAPMSSYLEFADGALDAADLTDRLHLNAELVVLAACSSGRSQVLRGDELLGLSRSLLYAGVSSILAALWPVHEIPTRLFMQRFFENLFSETEDAGDFDPAQALAETQRWLRTTPASQVYSQMKGWKEFSSTRMIDEQLDTLWRMTANDAPLQPKSRIFSHPHFWSPYILIGDKSQGPFKPVDE
jgi:CHAT domain-containing protein